MGVDLELQQRIDDFDFDLGAPPGYFVDKLASDHGWSRPLAERVVVEYRRYLYLACVADHVVVPSDHVDMAWHQHILDSEQYLGPFCQEVLGRPLHHHPGKGGNRGVEYHQSLYAQTLTTYAEVYGEQTPADIWPVPDRRFDPKLGHRRISPADNWIVPKRRRRVFLWAVLFVLGVLVTEAWIRSVVSSVAEYGMNIFCWDALAYLGLFNIVLALAVVVSYRLSRRLDRRKPLPDGSDVAELDPFDAAVLQCDTRRGVNVAVAALVYDGVLSLDELPTHWLVRAGALEATPHPLERAVYDAVGEDGCRVSDIHERTRPQAQSLLWSLEERDLLRSRWQIGRGLVAVLPLVPVCVLAFAGLTSREPEGAGLAMCIFWMVVVFVGAGTFYSGTRTSLGDAALLAEKARREPHFAADRPDVADGRELAWAIALHGVAVLAGGGMPELHSALTAQASTGGGGDGVKTAGCGGARDANSTGCGCG